MYRRHDFSRLTSVAFAALSAVACAAPPSKPADAPTAALDASYDWHVLLIAPFGSALKDVHLALHEVLLFRDDAPGTAGPGAAVPVSTAGEPECYALEGVAPRFMARLPSEYLMCFTHDRLSRMEASLQLAQAQSAQILAEACTLWTRNTAAAAASCEGVDANIAFAAHLEDVPDTTEARLIIQLQPLEAPADR